MTAVTCGYAMNSLFQDLRFAFRQLRRAPIFSLTVIGTLEPAIRHRVVGLNGSATVGHFTPLASTVDETLAQPRLNVPARRAANLDPIHALRAQ